MLKLEAMAFKPSKENSRAARILAANTIPRRGVPLGATMLSEVAWAEIARALKLSGREAQITRGIFDNQTEGAMAADLLISEHTIHEHLNRLFKKLRVTTRGQLILRVINEFLFLTLSGTSCLPPICPNHANGRCQVQDEASGLNCGVGCLAVG